MSKTMKSLPTLATPKFELNLPSTGEKIKYRPFLVKEEKLLLMAMESGETKDMSSAIRDIISRCTDDKIDVNTLPLFDVEYIFLQLRSKSVGEIADPTIVCPQCDNSTKIKLNISEINVKTSEEHNKKINITDTIGVIMEYPQLALSEEFDVDKISSDSQLAFDVIIRCIEKVWDGEEIYDTKEVGVDAVTEFVDNMSQDQFAKISKFFETMPHLSYELDFKCPHCQQNTNYELRGLQDFFGSPSAITT